MAAVTLAPAWKRLVKDTAVWWKDIGWLVNRFLKTGEWGYSEDCKAIADDQGGGDKPDGWTQWKVEVKRKVFVKASECFKINAKSIDLNKLRLDEIDARKITVGTIDVSAFGTLEAAEEHDPWELAYER